MAGAMGGGRRGCVEIKFKFHEFIPEDVVVSTHLVHVAILN
jgi:hypothetical protein